MTTAASGIQRISACDGVTLAFSCPQFRKNAELQVWLLDAADQDPETGTLLAEGANYTIGGVPMAGTATVTTAIAYPGGKFLCRRRATSRAQQVEVTPNQGIPAATQEDALDRAALVDEEIEADAAAFKADANDAIGRSIRFKAGQTTPELDRAAFSGKFFVGDALGNPVPAVGVGADAALRTDLAADGGDALIRAKRAEAGAVARTVQAKLREWVFAEDFGAVGDGVADDTTALQTAMNTGKVVMLKHRSTYLISSGLDHVIGSGLYCFGHATLKAKTGAGGFNVKDVTSAGRMNLDRTMLRCNLTDDLTVGGILFTTDGAAQVVINPLRIYGGMATEGYDIRASFANFAVGSLVVVSSLGAGRRRLIHIVSARDCGTSIGGSSGTYWTYSTVPASVYPQTTVVEIDNDTIAGAASAPGVVRIDAMTNILFTGAALADYAQQTDGVTIVTHGVGSTAGWDIDIGVIDGVGEPIDIQTNSHTIRIDTIKNAYNFAIKLIHGPQFCDIYVGTIEASGQAAVAIWGSSEAAVDTKGNTVRVGTVKNPGSYGIGPAATNACVVLFGNTNTLRKPVQNVVHVDNVIGDGVNLDCVVVDGGANAGNDNLVTIGKASGFALSVSAPPGNVRVRYLGRCLTELTMSAVQAIASATATKLAFNAVAADIEGIAVTASNKIAPKWPGTHRVQVSVQMSNWQVGASDQVTLEIRKNTTLVAQIKQRLDFSAKDQVEFLAKDILINEDEIGSAQADLTAWITQDTGANKNVGNTAYQTFFAVDRVA